jgi:hypothetical protein
MRLVDGVGVSPDEGLTEEPLQVRAGLVEKRGSVPWGGTGRAAMPRQHIIDLAEVQSRLDELCEQRFWRGLSAKEQDEYRDLVAKESELLDLRESVGR